jgi:hypothetical protein
VGGFGIVSEIFMPGRRFQEEEEHRLEWNRDEEGEADPCRGPVDLGSGQVVIRLGAAQDPAAPDA